MKKTMLLFSCLILSMGAFAQLKISENGNAMIGNGTLETPASPLSIGDSGNSNYFLTVRPDSVHGMAIYNSGGYKLGNRWGLRIYSINKPDIGAESIICTSLGSTTKTTYGIRSYVSGSSSSNLSIFGGLYSGSMTKGAGIYGSATSSSYFSYNGVFAGYFNGDVMVTGNLYGNLLSPSTYVSSVNKSSVLTVTDENKELVDKLNQLDLLQYSFKEKAAATDPQESNASTENMTKEELVSSGNKEDELLAKDNQDDVSAPSVSKSKSNLHYALDAEQLKKFFPELVYEDADGNQTVNYVEMVPLLVLSIRQLQSEIAELKGTANLAKSNVESVANQTTSIFNSTKEQLLLNQNVPNPCVNATDIKVSIPKDIKSAEIDVFDLNGTLLKRQTISERGKFAVNLDISSLSSGIFIYSLIADGSPVDTKRMIVSQ